MRRICAMSVILMSGSIGPEGQNKKIGLSIMAKQQRRFGLKLVFVSFTGLALSLTVGLSLHLLGIFPAVADATPDPTETYRHISLSDADHACHQHAHAEFGERIWVLTLDRRSSRLDQGDGLFKLFYEVELYPSQARQGQTKRHYINCFTAVNQAVVESFQYASEGEGIYRSVDQAERGLFGL